MSNEKHSPKVRKVKEHPKFNITVTGMEEPLRLRGITEILTVTPSEEGYEVRAHGNGDDLHSMGLAVMDFMQRIGILHGVMLQHLMLQMAGVSRGRVENEVVFRKAEEGEEEGLEDAALDPVMRAMHQQMLQSLGVRIAPDEDDDEGEGAEDEWN